jgi:hypothetical protein
MNTRFDLQLLNGSFLQTWESTEETIAENRFCGYSRLSKAGSEKQRERKLENIGEGNIQ